MNDQPQRHDEEAVHEVPRGVREAAQRAKGWIDDGLAGDGFTRQGAVRATQLATAPKVSLAVAREIAAFLARHLAQEPDEVRKPNGDPTPWLVAVDAWGGRGALAWAKAIVEQADRQDEAAPADDRLREVELEIRLDGPASHLSPPARALLQPPRQLPDGAWRVDAVFAKGDEVKLYEWGQEVAPWEELRADEVLQSLVGVPVTYSPHPKEVTPANAPATAISGARVLSVQRSDEQRLVYGSLALPMLPSQRGVSVGWKISRLDKTTSPPSQRGLRANHLTLTDSPRVQGAGLRLDSKEPTVKRTIHGVEFDLPDQAAQALDAERAAAKTRHDEIDGAAAAQKARAEKAEADAKAAAEKIKELEGARLDEAKVQGLVKARLELERKARAHLPEADAARLDAMTEAEIKRACLKVRFPALDVARLDGPALDGAWAVLGTTEEPARRSDEVALQLDGRRQDAAPAVKPGVPLDAHFNNPPKKA